LLRNQRWIQLRERREDLASPFFIDQIESEPGVDDRVIADLGLRNERQANSLADAAEGDDALEQGPLLRGLLDRHDLTGNSQAHGFPPTSS